MKIKKDHLSGSCRSRWTLWALMFFGVLAVTQFAFAQGVTGRIAGTVVDSSEAVIANATVTVTNQDTGVAITTATDARGSFQANNLTPGNYQVQVVAAGMQTKISKGIVVTVDSTTPVPIKLKIGAQTESVTVSEIPTLFDTTSASLGEVLDSEEVTSLPLNGRVFSQLVQTVPGSVAAGFGSAPEAAAGAGSYGSTSASVNGMPWGGTTYTLDGVSDMEQENAFINVTPPLDSIQEMKISTNNADITVGTYGGAQVNAFIKSGTNQFHGSAYEFFRDDALNADQWGATSKAPYRANQFGASIGGPVLKNKIFFFADYQGLLLRNGISYILTVPTQLMTQGTFLKSQFPDPIYDPETKAPFPTVSTQQGDAWQIPTGRFDPVSANMVAANTIWPAATDQSGISNNYKANTVEPDNNHQFDVKADYQITEKDRIFGRESYQRRDLSAPSPGTPFIQIGDVNALTRDHNAALGYDHTFSPRMLNELRFGFDRFYTKDFGNDLGTNENSTLGIPNGNDPAFGATGIGDFSIGNIAQTGSQGWTNSHRISNSYQITDNLTRVWGAHTFVFGEDYRRLQASLTNSDANKNGDFTYISDYTSSCTLDPNCSNPVGGNQFASFLLGLPSYLDRGYVATEPATRAIMLGVYAQDQYKVSRNLTLTLAIRWDVITPAIDKNNRQSNFDLVNGVLDFATNSNRAPNVDNYYGGWSPRVGFAYTPGASNTTFSGAFGVTHFPGNFGALGGFLERNFPFFEVFTNPAQQRNIPLAPLSVSGLPVYVPTPTNAPIEPPPSISVSYMDRHMQPNVAYAWNFGVQQRLSNATAFSLTYVGTHGLHLFRRYNINTPPPGDTPFNSRLPYQYFNSDGEQYATNIGFAGGNGNSIYHALQAELKAKFGRSLTGRVNYTWSKELDDMNVWWPLEDRVNRGEGTSQAPNVPQNFIVSFVYQLPFGRGEHWLSSASRPVDLLLGGWELTTISKLQSGTPLSFNAAYDNLGSGVTNHAEVTCPHVRTLGSVSEWFDTSCFTTPAPLQLGNSGFGKVHGPGYYNSDLSLSKSVTIHESMKASVQLDAFNLSNTPHYSNPDTNLADSNFGQIGGTNGNPRQLQIGVHFTF